MPNILSAAGATRRAGKNVTLPGCRHEVLAMSRIRSRITSSKKLRCAPAASLAVALVLIVAASHGLGAEIEPTAGLWRPPSSLAAPTTSSLPACIWRTLPARLPLFRPAGSSMSRAACRQAPARMPSGALIRKSPRTRLRDVSGGSKPDRAYSVAIVSSAPLSAMPFSSISAASRSRRIQSAPSVRAANAGTAPITRSNFDSPRAWVSE